MLRSSNPVFKTNIIKVTSTQRGCSSNGIFACTLSTRLPSFMQVTYEEWKTSWLFQGSRQKPHPGNSKPSGWSQPDLMVNPPQLISFSYKRQKQVSLQQINRSRYCWRQPNKNKICQVKRVKPPLSGGWALWLEGLFLKDLTPCQLSQLLPYGLKQLHGAIRLTAHHWDSSIEASTCHFHFFSHVSEVALSGTDTTQCKSKSVTIIKVFGFLVTWGSG